MDTINVMVQQSTDHAFLRHNSEFDDDDDVHAPQKHELQIFHSSEQTLR